MLTAATLGNAEVTFAAPFPGAGAAFAGCAKPTGSTLREEISEFEDKSGALRTEDNAKDLGKLQDCARRTPRLPLHRLLPQARELPRALVVPLMQVPPAGNRVEE